MKAQTQSGVRVPDALNPSSARVLIERIERRVLLSAATEAVLLETPYESSISAPLLSSFDPASNSNLDGTDIVRAGDDTRSTILGGTVTPAIGLNFEGVDRASSGFIPPDTMGSAGDNHIVEIINGRYRVWDKSGTQLRDRTLDQFWSDSGISPTGFSFDPRIVYDDTVNRWYVCAVDNARSANSFLFAVSRTANPLDGWAAFRIDSDPINTRWADFPQLGYDSDGVYITANMFDLSGGPVQGTEVNILIIPKSGLTAVSPTTAGRTLLLNQIGATGFAAQPVVYPYGDAYPPRFVSGTANSVRFSAIGGTIGSPTAAAAGSTVILGDSSPPAALQPNGTRDLETGGDRIGTTVNFVNNDYHISQTIEGSLAGSNAAVRYVRVDNGFTLEDDVQIQATGRDYFYPSVAVNSSSEIVIGFSGSGSDIFPSAMAVWGTYSGTTTTLNDPLVVRAGTANYRSLDGNGRNRWGDYSHVTYDPGNDRTFWSFQEYSEGATQWSTQVTQITPSGQDIRTLPLSTTIVEGHAVPFGLTGLANDSRIFTGTSNFDTDLGFIGDIEFIAFGGDDTLGSSITVSADDLGSTNLDLELGIYDAVTGELLFFNDDRAVLNDDPQIVFTRDLRRRYIAAIADRGNQGTGIGDINVTIQYSGTNAGTTIATDVNGDGSTTYSMDTPGGDADFYNFIAPINASGGLQWLLTSSAALDATVTIFNAAGTVLAYSDSAGTGGTDIGSVPGGTIVPGATYYATITPDNYASTGTGTFTIDFSTPPGGLPLTSTTVEAVMPAFGPGASALDTYAGDVVINFNGDIDYNVIQLDNSIGNTFTVNAIASAGSTVDPAIALYDRLTGALLASNTDGGGGTAARIMYTGTSNQQIIVAVADQQADSIGDVDVSVAWTGSFVGADVTLNAAGDGSSPLLINPDGDQDFYRFTTPATDFAGNGVVTFTANAGIQPNVFVFDALGELVASGRTTIDAGTATATLSGLNVATEYYITVSDHNFQGTGSGTLNINLTIVPVPLPPGQPDLVAASDTGSLNTDNITRDTTPTFTGTAVATSTVRLYASGALVGTTTANAAGNWSLTTGVLADGTYNMRATADLGSGESAPSTALVVRIDTAAPTVSASFAYETEHVLTLDFNENIFPSLTNADVVIRNETVPFTVADADEMQLFIPAFSDVEIRFPGFPNNILPDGDYALSIAAGMVEDLAGNPLPAFSYDPDSFFVLSGDFNHDRNVNVTDLGILAANFRNPGTYSMGDGNYDGIVNVTDLGILAANFRRMLPVSLPATFSTTPLSGRGLGGVLDTPDETSTLRSVLA